MKIKSIARTTATLLLGVVLTLSTSSALGRTISDYCSTCSTPVNEILWIKDLSPGMSYIVWWKVAHEDGGEPYYYGSQNFQKAKTNGTLLVLIDSQYSGYYDVYVENADSPLYDESYTVAECEFKI